MRISDWSSDVCSSDLTAPSYRRFPSNTRSDLSFRSLPWFMDQSYQYPVTVTNEISYLCTVETVLEKKDIRAFSPEELKTVFERMGQPARSEEHTSELQSLMRISYAVFCLKKKKK